MVWNKEKTVLEFVSMANTLVAVLGIIGKLGEEPALGAEVLSSIWAVVGLRIQQSYVCEVT